MSRTIDITKTVYKFSELDDGAKQNALEDYVLNGIDYDWWDCIEERLKESMEELGIHVEKMYFSGFSSQGDGACFEGQVDDWAKFLWRTGLWKQYPRCFANAEELGFLTWKCRGRYTHENSLEFDDCSMLTAIHPCIDRINYAETDEEAEVAQIVFNSFTDLEFSYELEDLREEVIEFVREKSRETYRSLRDDYDYLTSLEAFAEACDANEWEFDSEGNLV